MEAIGKMATERMPIDLLSRLAVDVMNDSSRIMDDLCSEYQRLQVHTHTHVHNHTHTHTHTHTHQQRERERERERNREGGREKEGERETSEFSDVTCVPSKCIEIGYRCSCCWFSSSSLYRQCVCSRKVCGKMFQSV